MNRGTSISSASTEKIFQILVGSVALLLLCVPAFSQLNLGRIYGTVTDQSGGVIVDAKVTIIDVQRGITRPLVTDSAGQYSAPSLIPGDYTVRAGATGFKTVDRTNIVVGVGQNVSIDLILQPGEQTQTLTVSAATPLVNTTNSVLSATVESQSINELPINGRLYTKLLDFQPGIVGHPGGNSPNYSDNGASVTTNYWMLDGVENLNIFVNAGPLIGAATSSDELTILPADSIQEVNVMSNPTAEFGWMQGAVVNVGLKSGTNIIHGSVYAFGRDTALDAKNPFLNGPPSLPKADDLYQQYGASVGGPIKKDKLFYFANFEGMRYTVGSPSFVQIPSSVANAGGPSESLPDAINGLAAAGVPVSQLSLNLAGCTATIGAGLVPVPGTAACNPTKGVFRNGTTNSQLIPSALDDTGSSNNVIGKIDYHPNDRNSINGEYFFGNSNDNSSGNGVEPWWVNGNHNRTQAVRGVWIYIPNSNWVNEVRFGYNRYNLVDYNAECTQQVGQPNYPSDFGFVSGANPPPAECGFPSVSISGYTSLGAGGGSIVFQYTDTFYDNISYSHGKHQLKFGAEFHHSLYSGYGTPGNFTGTIGFAGGIAFAASTPLQDFLAGSPSSGQILVNAHATSAGLNRYAGYFQDDWRVSKRLTLNLGLRYEWEPPIYVNNNAVANFDPASPTGMVQESGRALYNPDYRDFGPRAGFAWDLTGKGTTVVRGGVSIMYDTPQMVDLLSGGANLAAIPSGFTLFNADGTIRPNPDASIPSAKTGVVSIPGTQLNWVCNNTSTNCSGAPNTVTPVFQTGASALTCGNGLGTNPAPCTLLAKATNSPRSPMYIWTLGIQQSLGNNMSITAAYVGSHADHLENLININQPTLGASAVTAVATVPAGNVLGNLEFRQPYYNQFPYLGAIWEYSAIGFSNYNALQMTWVERGFHGLTMKADYTYARSLGTPIGDDNPYVQDGTHLSQWYGPNPDVPKNHFGLTLTYPIPGRKSLGQMLEGWEINSTLNIQSGDAFDANDLFDDFAGVGYSGPGGTGFPFMGTNWTLAGNPKDFHLGKEAAVPCFGYAGSSFSSFGCSAAVPAACVTAATNEAVNVAMNAASPGSSSGLASLQQFGCYMEGSSVIIPPAQGTFGNMAPNSLYGAGFHEWDFSATKRWKFGERVTGEFRAEFFNFLNNRTYAPPNSGLNNPASFGLSPSAPNSANPINGTGGPREIQLGFKLLY